MNISNTVIQLLLASFVTVVAVYFLYSTWKLSKEGFAINPDRFKQFNAVEGFGGVARGSGAPDCLRESQKAAKIHEIFLLNASSTEEGPDDLRELTLLLSKTCCLKKDLLSPSGIVEATRYQTYSTAHDIEAVAETTARCLAKTIPQRDLDIIIDKWTTRGKEIIRRLCTSYNIKDSELNVVDTNFKEHMDDIRDIANSQCIVGEIKVMKGPRDVTGYEPPELVELREYKGYY